MLNTTRQVTLRDTVVMAQTELRLVAGSIPAGETPEVQEDFWGAQPRRAQQFHFRGYIVLGSVGHNIPHDACL